MFPAFLRLLSGLPLAWLHIAGSVAGQLTFWMSAAYRRHFMANLHRAGIAAAPLAAASARQAGRGIFELPFVWMRPEADVLGCTATTDWDLVTAAKARGKGIIFLTPHLGCFEVTAQYFAINRRDGAPITVLFRRPRQDWLLPVIEGHRARANLRLAAADVGGVRKLLRALKRGEAVGLLPDQVPSNGEGIWAPFFGTPAYTMTLPARLYELSGATVLLAWGERLPKGQGFVVHLSALPEALHGTLEEKTAQLNAAMEALILACPEQYYWGYNRYKVPRGVTPAGLAA